MSMDDMLRLLAGLAILAGLVLGWLVSHWFFLIVPFAALNLIQSAFTKWCPAMWVLRKMDFR